MPRTLLGAMGERSFRTPKAWALLTRNLGLLQKKYCPSCFQLVSSDVVNKIETI